MGKALQIQSPPQTAVTLSSEIVSQIVLKGDISSLSPQDKVQYYRSVCERVGLDPATQPFQLLKLSGKEVLYCSKAGAEQLTKIHKVSHEIRGTQAILDVHVVSVRASLPDGRFEDSTGAVTTGNLKGDNLANALMKAETKAKRRSTLSLLGLGMLDETEIETIPGAVAVEVPGNAKKFSEDLAATAEVEEVQQKPKRVVVDDVAFNEFNPETDEMPQGKYKGLHWVEVPVDYLQWLSEKGSPDIRTKCVATLNYKKQMAEQQGDPLDKAFGKKGAK